MNQSTAGAAPLSASGTARVHKITRSAKGSPLATPWLKLAVAVAVLRPALLAQPAAGRAAKVFKNCLRRIARSALALNA
ncbi:MAG: hypothetical protein Tsb0016_16760 [Sphingomonadales bacterium]